MTWSVGWRGAVGGVVCLSAALGTGMVWTSDPADRAARDDAAGVASGSVSGADLFRAKGCAGCHRGPDDSGDEDFDLAPDLSDAPDWAGERRPGMSAEDYVAESIRQPAAFTSPAFGGGSGPMDGMPNLEVSEPEIEALVAYLLQLSE